MVTAIKATTLLSKPSRVFLSPWANGSAARLNLAAVHCFTGVMDAIMGTAVARVEAGGVGGGGDGGGGDGGDRQDSLLTAAFKATAGMFRAAGVYQPATLQRYTGIMGAVLGLAGACERTGDGDGGSSCGSSGGGDGGCGASGRAAANHLAMGPGDTGGVSAAGTGQPGLPLQQQASFLRLVSVCLAHWLPLCAALLAGSPHLEVESLELLQLGYTWMVRLARLAQGAAEGRGDERAAGSWGRLLGTCRSVGLGGQGRDQKGAAGRRAGAGQADDVLAPLLAPPCNRVLPGCSNPLCVSLEGASEAGMQLVACGGRCGGAGCGGEGPCCCGECAKLKSWVK